MLAARCICQTLGCWSYAQQIRRGWDSVRDTLPSPFPAHGSWLFLSSRVGHPCPEVRALEWPVLCTLDHPSKLLSVFYNLDGCITLAAVLGASEKRRGAARPSP